MINCTSPLHAVFNRCDAVVRMFSRSTIATQILFLLMACLGVNGPVHAQSFTASVNAKQVVVDRHFDLTFTFENISGGDFKPPDFKKDFLQMGGTSRAVSNTMINGKVTRKETIIYRLKPRRTGTFTIGAARLEVGGKVLKTAPLTIVVLKGASGNGDKAPEVFIRAEPSTTEAFVGQQIFIDYKLYTTVDVERSSILEESEYQGFFAQEIRRFDNRPIQEVIDGVQYTTKVIRRISLFPQQTGKLSITPFSLQLGVATGNNPGRQGFFFNRDIQQVPVSTETVSVNVFELPDGAPESFTGAVGSYQQIIALNRRTLTTDDALTLKVSIVGDGDIKRVQTPNYDFPSSFEVYEPKVLEEATYESNGEMLGKKVFEYLLVPNQAGKYLLQPAFTYFSPDSLKYITLDAAVYEVTVRQGSNRPTDDFIDKTEEGAATLDYLKLDTRLYKKKSPFFNSFPFWSLVILPFLMLSGLLAFRAWKNTQQDVDPGLIRRKKAQKVAAQRLAIAATHLKNEDSRPFYDEISKAFLGYVCDKLQVPRSTLTKDGLQQRLTELNQKEELIQKVMEIIRTSEVALFAGQDNREAMQSIYDKSLQALSEMEDALSE
jgi:hypothetical protein